MEYRIVEKNPFKVLTKIEVFDIMDNKVPEFWDQCAKDGTFDILRNNTRIHDIFGLCSPTVKSTPYFDYGIGMLYEGGEIPEGFAIWEVLPTTWAVFSCYGDSGKHVQEMWDKIANEEPFKDNYKRLSDTDFEFYSSCESDCFCEIWIPVKKIK